MSEWKETTLADLCTDISYGYTESAKQEKIGPKFLRITDIASGRLEWDKVPYCPINESDFEKYKLLPGDIVIARTGATTGANYTIKESDPKDVVFASYLIRCKINPQIANPYYIGQLLRSPNWSDYVDAIAGGSAQPGANAKQLGSFEFLLPSIDIQTAIASILSSLDDKIDLLHRQNATLEKMAETLFRQWFVERCPEPVEGEEKEEWEIKKLGAIAEIQNGFAFSSKDYVEYADTHLEVFKMGHIQKGGGLRTDPKRDYVPRSERLKRWILNKGDIVMAMTDMKDNVVILGVPAMIDKDDNYVLNQRVARIYLKDKSNLISNYLLFIQLKDVDFIQELQSKANSGVQVNLSTESIKDSDIIIPPLAIQKEKSPIIDDLYTKVELNQTQIRTLTALRDTLLPKLMSGEVRVEE